MRVALLALSAFALAAAAIALVGAAVQWWHGYQTQKRWPRAEAVIKECAIVAHRGRNSVMITQSADCSVAFEVAGTTVNGGFSTIPTSRESLVAEYRRWIDQHPPGTRITVHYDPSWPPSAVPEGPDEIFDTGSPRVFLVTAAVAGVVGIALLGAALAMR